MSRAVVTGGDGTGAALGGARLADMHTHTTRCGHAGGADEAFIEAAIAAGLGTIAVTDHLPLYWLPAADRDPTLAMTEEALPAYVDAVLAHKERFRDRIEVILGVEADFVAGHEERLAALLQAYPFDVVLGSVHWLDGWCVDAPWSRFRYLEGEQVVDAIWRRYGAQLCNAARCGLFDILAHLDLPKKFGFFPSRPFAGIEDEVVAGVAASGCAVELSSAGRRRPVGEDYPSSRLVQRLVEAGVPFVLGSDAHAPAEVGFALPELANSLRRAGATETVLFRSRERQTVALTTP